MNISFLLDAIVALLLFLTIGYCWRLSRKISALRAGKKDLDAFVQEFNQSIIRAEKNVAQLKELSQNADVTLAKHIDKARFLSNDLSFLMGRAETIADALEQQVQYTRTKQNAGAGFVQQSNNATSNQAPRPQAEGKRVSPAMPSSSGWQVLDQPQVPPKTLSSPEVSLSKRKALEEVLEQIASRKAKRDQIFSEPEQPASQATQQAPAKKAGATDLENVFDKRRLSESMKITQ
jgi:hypothetical protein